MRLERLRAYTGASGPLYFGRIDRAADEPLYIGRHAVADPSNQLLAINWRAPAAEPFYAATTADPRGVTRRRRLDIEDRRGARLRRRAARRRRARPPDRRDRRGHHPPARRRDAPDHLDDHAGAVRADHRAARRDARGAGRPRHRQDRRRPAPGGVAAVRRPAARARGRARRRPEPRVHRLHRAGAAVAGRAERRAAADRRARLPAPVGGGGDAGARDAARQRAHGRRCSPGCCGRRSGRRRRRPRSTVARTEVELTPRDVARADRRGAHAAHLRRRARALPRAARRPARDAR